MSEDTTYWSKRADAFLAALPERLRTVREGTMEVVVNGREERREVDHFKVCGGADSTTVLNTPCPAADSHETVVRSVSGKTLILKP